MWQNDILPPRFHNNLPVYGTESVWQLWIYSTTDSSSFKQENKWANSLTEIFHLAHSFGWRTLRVSFYFLSLSKGLYSVIWHTVRNWSLAQRLAKWRIIRASVSCRDMLAKYRCFCSTIDLTCVGIDCAKPGTQSKGVVAAFYSRKDGKLKDVKFET